MQAVIRESEDHYKEDYEYSIQVIRWLLKPIGAWPESSTRSTITNILTKMMRLSCYIVITSLVVPGALYTIFEEKDFRLKLIAIGPTSYNLVGGMSYSAILYHGDLIRESIKDIENDWRMLKGKHNRKLMLKSVRMGRAIVGIFTLIAQGAIFLYDIGKGMTSVDVVINNETITTHLLPCPSFNLIIDTRISPVHEIVLILQCMSTIVVSYILVSSCALSAVFAMHACGQLDIIMLQLKELTNKQEDVVQSEMADIVRRHIGVLRFIGRMEIIMREICFLEVIECTLAICVLGFYIITEWNSVNLESLISYMLLIMSMTCTIFIFCFIGDLVIEQCKKVGEAAYMMNWYYLPPRTAFSLIFIILRSSVPVKITGGKIFPMSVITFGSVMKASVVYLNMLRTLTM